MRTRMIFPVLKHEMKRQGITLLAMAGEFGMNRDTLSRYLSGKSELPYSLAVQIQERYFDTVPLKDLFSTDEKAALRVAGGGQFKRGFIPSDSNGICEEGISQKYSR